MLRFLCCAFCALLVSPALAIDVFEDYTITTANEPAQGEKVRVYGDAVLTVNSGIVRDTILLFDSSNVVLNDGLIRGGVHMHGANDFTMYGGWVQSNSVTSYSDQRTSVNLLGGKFSPSSVAAGNGHHELFADLSKMTQIPVGFSISSLSSGTASVRYASEQPYYRFDSNQVVLNIGGTLSGGDGGGTMIQLPDESYHNRFDWLLESTLPFVDGDANGDGVVDLGDLNAIRNGFGSTSQMTNERTIPGDTLPYDGVVDLEDLNRIRNNFGATQSVPEPSTLTVALLGMLALAGIPLRCRYRLSLLRSP